MATQSSDMYSVRNCSCYCTLRQRSLQALKNDLDFGKLVENSKWSIHIWDPGCLIGIGQGAPFEAYQIRYQVESSYSNETGQTLRG